MGNRWNLYLAALAVFVLIGFLGESEPVDFFGYAVNVWVMRGIWLFIAVANFYRYYINKKAEK